MQAYAQRWGTSTVSCPLLNIPASYKPTPRVQASSHVAGIIAYLISKDGEIIPAAMKEKLLKLAVRDVLTNIRKLFSPLLPLVINLQANETIAKGTPNLLAQLGPA